MKTLITFIILSFTFVYGEILGSKHDLSYSSTNIIRAENSNMDYLCVFCHTPHAANSSYSDAPIWNKSTNTQSYTTYGTTMSGTSTSNVILNSSRLCLSCHDGVSAINSIINAPGSGLNGGFVKMNSTTESDAFKMPVNSSNLGINLQNTHPISIEYKEGKGGLKNKNSDLGTGWKTTDGINKVSSLLKNGNVECVSCHDPHLGENIVFLRSGNNIGSRLCLGCHDK